MVSRRPETSRKCLIFVLVLVLALSQAVLVIVIEFRPFDYEHEQRAPLALSTSPILRSQSFSPNDPAQLAARLTAVC